MGQGQAAPKVDMVAAVPEPASTPEEQPKKPSKSKVQAQHEDPWLPPGSYKIDPDKPHRKPANSCTRIREDMVQCYEKSPCYKSGAPFDECLNSNDPEYVTSECIWLRKGYCKGGCATWLQDDGVGGTH